MTAKGLYCPAGNFHIDPKGGVEHAIITHAHSDHARRGSKKYYCTTTGLALLKERIGDKNDIISYPYQENFSLNGVEISFHPAGHILGSAQVRIKFAGEVWVVSGDYKRDIDRTCHAFEVVKCDVFITEATFGTPTYVWKKQNNVGKEIFDWWLKNAECGLNSVILAYSLGKAQRILNLLAPFYKKAIYCEQATNKINHHYRAQHIVLAETKCISSIKEGEQLKGELIIIPPGYLKRASNHFLGLNYQIAFASGWVAKNNYAFDKGFLISDHADWHDLINTVMETEAKRVFVQHRGNGALVKALRARGLKAFSESVLQPKNPNQLQLF